MVFLSRVLNHSRRIAPHAVRIGLLCMLAAVLTPACEIEPGTTPTLVPTAAPTLVPTAAPTLVPTAAPTLVPTAAPTLVPTAAPTLVPTAAPTLVPTPTPTLVPTATPTPAPTATPTPAPTVAPTPGLAATPEVPSATQLSIAVAPVPGAVPDYDRGEWRHWVDEDSDCQDTRQEVLVAESVSLVVYEDSRQCRVASGTWVGPYTGEQLDDPRGLDVDHMVPLGNAHQSGGWAWSDAKKRQYANDLSYDNHLIAVQASANRSKGSKSPASWKPPDLGYWCQYAIDWTVIKDTWELTATEPEAEALGEMLDTCTPSRTLTVVRIDISETAEPTPAQSAGTPSPSPTPASTYASCDEAEAAGEPRVQGSSGSGRGFPQAKVPSARDGDGDGVVCEK